MKRFIIKVVLLLGIAFIVINILSFSSLASLRNSSFYKPSFLVNELNDQNLDYIVLGSSVGLTGLNTATIDKHSGLQGINLAMDDTGMSSHYLMLQHFLAEGNPINFCILSPTVDNFEKERDAISKNDYRFLMFINRPYIQSYFSNFKGLEADLIEKSPFLPMMGVSYYNSEIFYPSLITAVEPSRRNRFDARGNYSYPVTSVLEGSIENRDEKTIEFKNTWLQKIVNLCKENNIELIYYLAPMKKMKIKPETSDIRVVNFSHILNNSRYFYDDIHVNSDGREKVSQDLALILKSLYNTKEE